MCGKPWTFIISDSYYIWLFCLAFQLVERRAQCGHPKSGLMNHTFSDHSRQPAPSSWQSNTQFILIHRGASSSTGKNKDILCRWVYTAMLIHTQHVQSLELYIFIRMSALEQLAGLGAVHSICLLLVCLGSQMFVTTETHKHLQRSITLSFSSALWSLVVYTIHVFLLRI